MVLLRSYGLTGGDENGGRMPRSSAFDVNGFGGCGCCGCWVEPRP